MLKTAVAVEAVDDLGNRTPSAAPRVTLSVGDNPAGGLLSGTLQVDADRGLATFDDLSLDRPGVYNFNIAVDGLSAATVPVTVTQMPAGAAPTPPGVH